MRSDKEFQVYKGLDLPQIDAEVLKFWNENNIFEKSIEQRSENDPFVFYEGPPSANGIPGIHHVMSRTIKDLFCRYKSMKGFRVNRKGGWDTHGLPVELGVEKKLNISKEDIGKKISVEDYNKECRKEVMKYKEAWDNFTQIMGYWVDLDDPYITFNNDYIESIWYLLKQLHEKDLLYKGYTIQPFSPAAGTGLSSHELNLPGCYREVKDTTVVAQFKIKDKENEYFLAWTTTPWTLPSNTGLVVGPDITYVKVKTYNQYTSQPVTVILAKDLLHKWFKPENADLSLESYGPGQKEIPFKIIDEFKGSNLVGIRYEQLMPYVQPEGGDPFRVVPGDFVTTEDGTGIVHIAPTFGSDDMRVGEKNNIPPLTVKRGKREEPLVDKQGKFVDEVTDFAGRYVKNFKDDPDYISVDVDIVVQLKKDNKAFKVEKYEHSYPHCWRTDKPILYYPLESWFIRTTALKERLVELNKTINWKPASTGTGRFGNWLENLVDWNLSRSRYWGTPLPVWVTEDREEIKCIGSIAELKEEVANSVKAGFMQQQLSEDFDLHKPFIDEVILIAPSGKKMLREPDLIDVWFDSGAMPYAQWHYPFENKDIFEKNFPADFIAEGVDQTRGWFFTLHAIAGLLFDSVAFKNVLAHGLVLDKHGNKMSKRLGNAADPFDTIKEYGADATRWYMISNSQPWDNLKFDLAGIDEVKRKFFGTLYNTYSFFALYANIDGFKNEKELVPVENRPEIDRWIISLLNTLVKEVDDAYDKYEPTKAARAIQAFVIDNLSNWYVRMCRKRFWKGEYNEDKIAAYQTLYQCLESVAQLMASIAPFYADALFRDLEKATNKQGKISVHLTDFPIADDKVIDSPLERRMQMAQDISSLVLGLRKKVNIKVRQPLSKIMLPILNENDRKNLEKVENLILSEVNVKNIEYVTDTSGIVVKKAKPDFKALGPRYGKKVKAITAAVSNFSQKDIAKLEKEKVYNLNIDGEMIPVHLDEVEIVSEDIPGWLVAHKDDLTVALDVTITEELRQEGIARELVNRIQNIRKQKAFDVTDRIKIKIEKEDWIESAIKNNLGYICRETLAEELNLETDLKSPLFTDVNEHEVKLLIDKV